MKATCQTKQFSKLRASLCSNVAFFVFFFLKWIKKVAALICGRISHYYFVFTETTVSMQWLDVDQCVWWKKGDADAHIYFHWHWTWDNAWERKEKVNAILQSRVLPFPAAHTHKHKHTNTQWSHELADWVAFLSWSFARMRNSTSWSSHKKRIQISQLICT